MKMFPQAARLSNAPLSKIREVIESAAREEKSGRSVIHLEIGEPDFSASRCVRDAAMNALQNDSIGYGPIMGQPKLRRAIGDLYGAKYGIPYAEEEVIVTHGVAQGLFLVIMSFLDDGDEILVPDPGYLVYDTLPKIAGAKAIPYDLRPERNYQIDGDMLEAKVTSRTRMILINSPNNPTGTILDENSLEAVRTLARRHNLIVVSDEIYREVIYGGTFSSIASMDGMRERTIILNGFSKYYAMTGWRIGYILCPHDFMDPIMRLSFYNIACPVTFIQNAAYAALTGEQGSYLDMVHEYGERRDFLCKELNDIPTLSCHVPDGTFYVMLDVRKTGMSSDEFCMYLLRDWGVAMVPGQVFGGNGEGFVRISFSVSLDILSDAVKRIRCALERHQRLLLS
jgi:aminotransferase